MTDLSAGWKRAYDTPTGENGNLLSAGERQRLSIARAILKDSPILLLDEATAIPGHRETSWRSSRAIANLLKAKKTVVMIAHTLSIVKNADQILVVQTERSRNPVPTRAAGYERQVCGHVERRNRKSLYK